MLVMFAGGGVDSRVPKHTHIPTCAINNTGHGEKTWVRSRKTRERKIIAPTQARTSSTVGCLRPGGEERHREIFVRK